nr:EAL domain-containing protein [uncultured Desulfobulbus sp.]
MNAYRLKPNSIQKKLVQSFIAMLVLGTITIGIVSFMTARDALNQKGETILKNSVIQAIQLIEATRVQINSGFMTLERGQEYVKTALLGPRNANGTRNLHNHVDLGQNGYFIVYDTKGVEIMHPTLEGKNVWGVQDMGNNKNFLVQKQIAIALNGGGFCYYSWLLPHSNKVGKKISYSEYDPGWGWIVVATAYNQDFNKDARMILLYILTLTIATVGTVGLVGVRSVRKIVNPIFTIAEGLEKVGQGEYELIKQTGGEDEIAYLIEGYNGMIIALREARENIENKNRQLEYLAYYDELTGLHNRYGLNQYVNSRIRSNNVIGHLIQLDIAGLKVINSTMGFQQGDRVLKLIAQHYTTNHRGIKHIARTSSNEFTLWIENSQEETVKEIVNRFRDDVKSYVKAEASGAGIDFHMAMCAQETGDFDSLYEKTTMAMKIAKEKNDFTIHIYEEDMREQIENELLMSKHLSNAIMEEKILPHYQSKIDYRTMHCTGVEALARWCSEELGCISPGIFIPAIIRLNLTDQFTRYLLDRVLSDYPKLCTKYGEGITVSVNISPLSFLAPGFVEYVGKMLNKHKIAADRLILEITEDVLINDHRAVSTTIEGLHHIGVKISIDDFGTGYSSLNYLVNIDFDEMKIDKSFIHQMEKDPKAFQLLKIICDIAELHQYSLVAEGVETTAQLDLIKDTPLRIIQGYLFSKPEALD